MHNYVFPVGCDILGQTTNGMCVCVCVCCAHYFLGLFNLLFISTNLFFRLGTHCTSIFKYRQQSLHINIFIYFIQVKLYNTN